MTRMATDNHDWFKFETRIRTIMKEMLEISVLRSKEIENETKKQSKKYEKIERKLEEQEYCIEKLEKKT